MKLAAFGVVTTAIGIGLGLPGLIGIGVFWVLLGPVMRQHGKRLGEMQAASADGKPPTDGRTFALGTLLWMLLGLPSLLVGILQIGIDADHTSWRWLPFAVGVLALGFGGIAACLYLLGRVAEAASQRVGVPEVPATLWISSVRETGTFVNERPRMEFVFRVEPEPPTGMAGYETTKKATVPYTAMAALRVGDGFKALVAGREHPTSMEIYWDQPVSGGAAAL
jgi:hypothetical protein